MESLLSLRSPWFHETTDYTDYTDYAEFTGMNPMAIRGTRSTK